MGILTTTKGQTGLPRYFALVYDRVSVHISGRLDVVLPDERRFRIQGDSPGQIAEIHIHDPDLFARIIREGDLGFSDAYLDGGWSTPDLLALMDMLQSSGGIYDAFPGMGLLRAYERLSHVLRANTKKQAKKNIAQHYDLGNDFYSLWLDETMTYSSALFLSGQEPLESAQIQKYASMVDRMGVTPGDHVLEIGCGWGGFAEYAAKERGLKVTALTISQAQHGYATQRIHKAGLSDRVEIVLRDYRDECGVYDGIASIEMFEAVGEKYWPKYFNTVHERLKPGRNATLQIITLHEKRWQVYRKSVDFIQKYIFPGGMLPSRSALQSEISKAGLSLKNSVEFGQSYSQTLRRWHERFNTSWNDIAGLGFDARFQRMWNFYLTTCAASFEHGNCDVTQVTVTRPVN